MIIVRVIVKLLKLVLKIIFFVVGLLLMLLGQGLILLSSFLSVISYFFTGLLFLLAIFMTFLDSDVKLTLLEKIFFWGLALLSGVLSFHITMLPVWLVDTGDSLMHFNL